MRVKSCFKKSYQARFMWDLNPWPSGYQPGYTPFYSMITWALTIFDAPKDSERAKDMPWNLNKELNKSCQTKYNCLSTFCAHFYDVSLRYPNAELYIYPHLSGLKRMRTKRPMETHLNDPLSLYANKTSLQDWHDFILKILLHKEHRYCIPIHLLILCAKSMYSFCEEKVHTFEYVAE